MDFKWLSWDAFHKLQQSIHTRSRRRSSCNAAPACSSIWANPRLFSRVLAVASQFGRPVQLFQYKPNTHPSKFKPTTHDVSCFLLILKWKRQHCEERRQLVSLSWRFMYSFHLEMKTRTLWRKKTIIFIVLCFQLKCAFRWALSW